jgi:hypothetical protein
MHTYLSTKFHAKTELKASFFKTQKDNGQDILGLKKLQHLPTTLPPA